MRKIFWRASKIRLYADVQAYIQELKVKFPEIENIINLQLQQLKQKKKLLPFSEAANQLNNYENERKVLQALSDALAECKHQINYGKIEIAWRLLNKAKQIEILGVFGYDELVALGKKFYYEASKLSENRKKSVEEITLYIHNKNIELENQQYMEILKLNDPTEIKQWTAIKHLEGEKMRFDVFYAAKIIGEYYDNEAYKVLLRTKTFNRIIFILVLLLLLIPMCNFFKCIYLFCDAPSCRIESAENGTVQIISVELLGLLGAAFSIIVSYSRSPVEGSVPQQKLIYSTTWLRLVIGSAAALILYILFSAKLILSEDYGGTLYALAFVSGFSENFIVDKLNNIANPSKK